MIEETLTRIAVALEAIAAKPPIVIMTAPADGGGQKLTGVIGGDASPPAETPTPAAKPATRGQGKKTLNAAEAAKLAASLAAITKDEAEKAERLAAMPPLPGTPIGGVAAVEADELVADAIPDDTTMKQAVIALLSNSKRPLAVKILQKYGVTNASAVPDEHRAEALALLQAALAA